MPRGENYACVGYLGVPEHLRLGDGVPLGGLRRENGRGTYSALISGAVVHAAMVHASVIHSAVVHIPVVHRAK